MLFVDEYSNSTSNVLVNASSFDGMTYRIRGADRLPWWSPSRVLATIFGVCSVEVYALCVRVLLCLVFIMAVHLCNEVLFLPVITTDITGHGKFL